MRRGGGSLDLKCYCFNALTDEGMQAVSSLTALTSLELWRCSKVTAERMRAVRSVARLTSKKTTHRSWVEQMELAASSPVRAEASVRCAGLQRA